ncbi:hypothetical protein ACFL3G_02240 [Planctomycetota bacterium]
MRDKSWFPCVLIIIILAGLANSSMAVSSKITRHASSADMEKGTLENVVIGSQGTIQLGSAAQMLLEELDDVWSINSIVVKGEAVFVGTSPNGGVYKYSLGKLTKIYPIESKLEKIVEEPNEPNDANAPEIVDADQYLTNEHIFAMATDVSGRLLVGISGKDCRLMRLEKGKMKTIFTPDDAKYIFAITVDDSGEIYLGTGPEGKVYKLDSFAKKPELIYDCTDKNILSLAIGQDGNIYAGSDSRGLIYKINPDTKTASIVYDSEQDEITALLFDDDGNLYAAATSAKIAKAEKDFASKLPLAGRPDVKSEKSNEPTQNDGGLTLEVANTKRTAANKASSGQMPPRAMSKPGKVSFIYKVSPQGYVTDVFSKPAVLLSLVMLDETLFVGTGNQSNLFTVQPTLELEAVIYEDKQASQITSLFICAEHLYVGTANPAKLIKVGPGFAAKGSFISGLIDASQPAKWGKLQIEADIPTDCKVQMVCRSGNVKDVNDPTFSNWTKPVEVTGPVQLDCPLGRFCQYKLILQSGAGGKSPVIREVVVASTVPNLAPKVVSVNVSRLEAAGKAGVFKISYKAVDDNRDQLIYKIEFRKTGRTNWIELQDDVDSADFEWDGKTVEDGRYEVRVTANDEKSNSSTTKLTGSRISETIVVDNTGPIIETSSIKKSKDTVTLKLEVSDKLSAIGQVHYTLDSNSEWKTAQPEDMVYDTKTENFTIVIEDVEAGEHVISLRMRDDLGNTTYKSFEF